MKLITGPVVGEISAQRARVLLETSKDGVLLIELQKQQAVRTVEVRVKAFRPVICLLRDLAPGEPCSYKVKTTQGEILYESSFRVPKGDEQLRVLVVSCNALHMLAKGDVDLWAEMLKKHAVEGGIAADLLFHIGDQVYEYANETWRRAREMLSCLQTGKGLAKGADLQKHLIADDHIRLDPKKTYDMEKLKEIVTEMYRNLYRVAWNHPPTKRILSMVSNHMVLDDHDIRNGWGIRKEDHTPDTPEWVLGLCAHRAYQEYQVKTESRFVALHEVTLSLTGAAMEGHRRAVLRGLPCVTEGRHRSLPDGREEPQDAVLQRQHAVRGNRADERPASAAV